MKTHIIAKLLESESSEDVLLGYTYFRKKFRFASIANIFLKKYRIKVYSYLPHWCTIVCYNTGKYKGVYPLHKYRTETKVTIDNIKDSGWELAKNKKS